MILLIKERWQRFYQRQVEFYHNNRISRLGLGIMGLSFVIGLAAINTGTNLLYLLFSFLVCLIVVNGILALLSFKKLTVEAEVPDEVFAGTSYFIRLTFFNQKHFLSSYSLRIQDRDLDAAALSYDYCLRVAPGEKRIKRCERLFLKRGWRHFSGVQISCDFPFGLVERTRYFRGDKKILVYPRVDRPSHLFEKFSSEDSSQSQSFKGMGEEVFEVRPYQEEDARFIHWKLSAKKDALMVKDFERPESPVVHVAFWASPTGADAFERAVEEIAGFCWRWGQSGQDLCLWVPGFSPAETRGGTNLDCLLTHLALVQPQDPSVLEEWMAGIPESGIMVCPRGTKFVHPNWTIYET